MPEQLDNPDQSEAIDSALAKLDIDKIAEKSNALTGGCLRGIDALKVARMVAFNAVRNPGQQIVVAGISGLYVGLTLTMGYSGELCEITI